MSRSWTDDQTHAINAQGGCILVAAAAGSGKTSVLTERVIQRITNPQNPVDIDKFLIVTFTKMAAQEMKNRISERLSQLIAQNPSNSNLMRQKMLVQTAHISTIHSFCTDLVKENFFKLDVSPKFKIVKDAELSIIENQAMENTMNHFFADMTSDKALVTNLLTNEKNDKSLSDSIHRIYCFTKSLPFMEQWMSQTLDMYKFDLSKNSVWEQFIINYTGDTLNDMVQILNRMYEIAHDDDILLEKATPILENCQDILDSLQKAVKTNKFQEIKKSFENNTKFCTFTLTRVKNLPYTKNIIRDCREYIKETVNNLKALYQFTESDIKNDIEYMQKVLTVLFDAVKFYKNEIQSIKLLKNVLEFSDLEHKTIQLLTENTENGIVKSDFAKDISEQFAEIMVDEYQDVNEVQDTIFKMISKDEKNIFMVGDVKQSIYRFRQSCPEIFLNKKNIFSLYKLQGSSFPAKILLGKNFRSHKNIIDGINFVFEKLMSQKTGEIEYNSEEKLIPGANYSLQNQKELSLKMISASKELNYETEAEQIAQIIGELIASGYQVESNGEKRNLKFSDFCVLIRSTKSCAHIYRDTLQRCGIPTWAESSEKFFETEEISSIISLLETINNPTLDVPLTATLLAPFFAFTIDELAVIRKSDDKIPLYFSLKKFLRENPDNQKIQEFLSTLQYYRNLSASVACDELLEVIYEKTAYPSICLSATDGYAKKANLIKFVEYARNFEKEYHSGISGFLSFINHLKEQNIDLSPANISSEKDNTVKIMSIHKSKGLEFPICILANCEKTFHIDTESLLVHPSLGIGRKLKNSLGTYNYDNIIRKAIAIKIRQENISEEMRILYVALTRAKQKLILTSTYTEDLSKKIFKKFHWISYLKSIPPYIVYKQNSFLEWILLALSQSELYENIGNCIDLPIDEPPKLLKDATQWSFEVINNNENTTNETSPKTEAVHIPSHDNINDDLLKIFEGRFNFKYPHTQLLDLPLKVSASQIVHSETAEEYIASSKPEFLSSKNLTPVHRGTAMHQFVCYSDFSSINNENIENKCNELLLKGFLTGEEFNSLDIKAIKKFISSKLFNRISKSQNILKEHRFSVKLPATKIYDTITEKNTFIIVQGALDCAFEEDNQYVIIDYKTDRAHDMHELYQKYKKQLQIYKYALEETTHIKVKELGIYSFYLNKYFSEPTD